MQTKISYKAPDTDATIGIKGNHNCGSLLGRPRSMWVKALAPSPKAT